MCICDDLMTLSRNHTADTFLFHHRNVILVATSELQERLKSIHLGDLFFFQPLFDECSVIPGYIPTYLLIEIGFW